ncbi:MAG: tetraacyldisaccharide 4'-kinase [Deltaproteobacteria bacterium]|nr:tetraacyldisaccharide 4'-kinase [Deltaproteobacteria bacterium]
MLNFRTILPRIWAGKPRTGALADILLIPFLALAALPFHAAVFLRNLLYDRGLLRQIGLPCPVISIGNITVGGTGKTPLTIMLAKLLTERGYKPAVLSRGYGGKTCYPLCVVSDRTRVLATAAEAGDEPLLIARSLKGIPVIVGADRIRTGQYAIRELGADVLILDDAFQHRRLSRNLDIVLLQNRRPFGNGYLLPRGPLREPVTALKRADILVLTGTDTSPDPPAAQTLPSATQFLGYYRPTALLRGGNGPSEPPESLKGKKICAFAGIANPASFRDTLESLGGEIVFFRTFPDHHPYADADIENIRKAYAASAAAILTTTEKDGMKLVNYPSFLQELFLLRVEMDILPSRNDFAEFILKKLK